MTEMTINKLPSKTWYWLHVNETKLPWDKEHTTELPEETDISVNCYSASGIFVVANVIFTNRLRTFMPQRQTTTLVTR